MLSKLFRHAGRHMARQAGRRFSQQPGAPQTQRVFGSRQEWGRSAAAFGAFASLATLSFVAATDAAYAVDALEQPPADSASRMKLRHDERRRQMQELIARVSNDPNLVLFSGRANVELAQEVADYLNTRLGNITVSRFADGEVKVQVNENVRGKDIYIFQPTCPPVNENLMELLLMVSTMRRASAKRITVIIPYYGYARQDRKMTARVPISAADVARLLESMGVDRVVAVDLHCGQIQGFFGPRVPVDNLDGGYVGVEYFGQKTLVNPVIVSPDAGGVYRAKKFREGLAK